MKVMSLNIYLIVEAHHSQVQNILCWKLYQKFIPKNKNFIKDTWEFIIFFNTRAIPKNILKHKLNRLNSLYKSYETNYVIQANNEVTKFHIVAPKNPLFLVDLRCPNIQMERCWKISQQKIFIVSSKRWLLKHELKPANQ